MNATMFSALAPILMLSLTAVVLMIQASIKRDQSVAWVITAVGFLLTLWSATGDDFARSRSLEFIFYELNFDGLSGHSGVVQRNLFF
jgi:hypothetical protein